MVSVIIPTYNREKTIKRSIISVLNQTYTDIEIIVVDDASTDRTEEIVLGINDPRIHYVRNKTNRGVADSRNIGVQYAKGNYLAFQDSDDVWKNNKLEKQMQVVSENSNCNLVYCAFYRTLYNGKIVRVPKKTEKQENLEGYIWDKLLHRNVISTQTILIKRDFFLQSGGFREGLRTFDDYEFVLRIAKSNYVFYVDEELVEVFDSPNSLSLKEYNAPDLFEGYMFLLTQYWCQVEDKSVFKYWIRDMLDLINYLPYDIAEVKKREIFPFLTEEIYFHRYVDYERRFFFKDFIMRKLLENDNLSFSDKLNGLNAETIAIYGNGYIGRVLNKLIEDAGYHVLYFIDQNTRHDKYKTYSLSGDLPKVDLVIISVYDDEKKIRDDIYKKIDAKIIYIYDFLKDEGL